LAGEINCEPHRQTLRERIDSARRLVLATELDLDKDENHKPDASREARGLAIVLLYAAYENLLHSLCRSLLETAAKSRAKARRLRPELRLFLAHGEMTSLADGGRKRLWKSAGIKIVSALNDKPISTINTGLFPDDGSFMKASQVALFCQTFGFGDPVPVLEEVWTKLNGVVDQRNGIAHGRYTSEEVGRAYSHDEVLDLITEWEEKWLSFLDWVENHCANTTFYLTP
jgi:hypothetical protein